MLVAAPFFIDANQYKSLIVDQAEKATGRHIAIGTLKVSLFPWVGVTLGDVHIANPKGFAEGDTLQVKSLDVQVAVMPLLGGKYQIERFVLDSPKLMLTRTADGFSNWEDLLGSGSSSDSDGAQGGKPASASQAPAASSASEAPAGGSALAALSARSLRMTDGELRYRDDTQGSDIELSALNIALDDVQMQRPVSLTVSGKLDDNAFELDGMVGPLGDLASLDVAKLPLKGHLNVPGADLDRLARLVEGVKAVGSGTLGLNVQLEQRPNGVRVMAGSLKLHRLADKPTEGQAAVEGGAIGIQTAPSGFTALEHDVTLDMKAQMPDAKRMQIEQLAASLDGEQLLDVNGTLTGIGDDLRYQLRVNTPELTRQQLSAWIPDLQGMYAGHQDPWKRVKLGMLAAGGTASVDIRDLQLMLDGELVQVTGSLGLTGDPDIRLRIASRQLHLDPWLPQPVQQGGVQQGGAQPTVQPAAQSTAQPGPANPAGGSNTANPNAGPTPAASASPEPAAVEPDLRFLKPWKIAAVMQIDRMWLRGLEMARLRADVTGKNGLIKLSPLRFELAGGRVEENASINAAAYPARWTESVKIRDVQVSPLLVALAGNDMLSGSLQMDTNLNARGLLPEAAAGSLSGNGNVLLRDGSIRGFDIAGTLRNLQSFGQPTSGVQKTDFSQLTGSFTMKDGLARNDDLFVASPLFRLTGYGQVDLKGKQMDYHLKPRLVGTLVGQGDSEAVRKGLEVPLRLTGPLEAPQVKLEVSVESLLGNREAIREIVKDPKAALKGLLGGVPGQAPAGQAPAGQATPQAQPKPLEQLLNRVLPGAQQPATQQQAPQQQQPNNQQPQSQQQQNQQPLNQLLNRVLPGF